MQGADIAHIFKALGDDKRLQILHMLAYGEKCACKRLEAFDISQPTLSHHMKILLACGLVKARKEGKWSHYSINVETLSQLGQFFSSLGCSRKDVHECQ